MTVAARAPLRLPAYNYKDTSSPGRQQALIASANRLSPLHSSPHRTASLRSGWLSSRLKRHQSRRQDSAKSKQRAEPGLKTLATSQDAAPPVSPPEAGGGGGGGGIWAALLEPIAAQTPSNPDPQLINEDFAPTLAANRIFSMWDLASLWVGLVVCKHSRRPTGTDSKCVYFL